MMAFGNVKMALGAIRVAKWRSFLTMLGIIIGVMSVVTIVSLGEGVKHQVLDQIGLSGSDLITVKPGQVLARDEQGKVTDVNLLQTFGGTGSFSENDLKTIQSVQGVAFATPFSVVVGRPTRDGRSLPQSSVVGVNEHMAQVLNRKAEFGEWFGADQVGKNVVIIGQSVAHELFRENAPIGQTMTIRGQNFIVAGVLERVGSSPLAPGLDYNTTAFIPYDSARRISDGQPQIQQIYARPAQGSSVNQVSEAIKTALSAKHGGQNDFTVLRQEDNLAIADTVITLLTGMISAVAAISLLVGGIGIMNIMLVAVSERTHEIGVRKAIGATNSQILGQFVTEATMISFVGGVIGVLGSLAANYFLRVFTKLSPVVTWQVVIVAVTVAVAVGVFFGTAPALKASRKDPIEALRQY